MAVSSASGRRTVAAVCAVPTRAETTRLIVVLPRDALRRARPFPSDGEMAIEGLTNEEWEAFERALAERRASPDARSVRG